MANEDEIYQNLFGAAQQARPISQLPRFAVPEPEPMKFYVDGMTEEQELNVRSMMDHMAPQHYPGLVKLLPEQEWNGLRNRMALGQPPPAGVPRGINTPDGWRRLRDGFTNLGNNQIWLNGGAYNDPTRFATVFSHEMGHEDSNSSDEGVAAKTAKPFLERLKPYLKK